VAHGVRRAASPREHVRRPLYVAEQRRLVGPVRPLAALASRHDADPRLEVLEAMLEEPLHLHGKGVAIWLEAGRRLDDGDGDWRLIGGE
jgi:hypothetical protein